jgi:hypothetical protein
MTRIDHPTEKDYQRLEKYQQILLLLLQSLEQDEIRFRCEIALLGGENKKYLVFPSASSTIQVMIVDVALTFNLVQVVSTLWIFLVWLLVNSMPAQSYPKES